MCALKICHAFHTRSRVELHLKRWTVVVSHLHDSAGTTVHSSLKVVPCVVIDPEAYIKIFHEPLTGKLRLCSLGGSLLKAKKVERDLFQIFVAPSIKK